MSFLAVSEKEKWHERHLNALKHGFTNHSSVYMKHTKTQ